MKIKGLFVAGALVAGAVVLGMRGGCLNSKSEPDQKLASRFDDMCKIAHDNIETPEKGVRKLGHYLDKHAGDLLGEWGETVAAIERIKDDKKHDQRARLTRDRLMKPLRACEQTWMEFGEAVEADPAASALVENFGNRLNRTLEIIFSGGPHFDLLHLPQQLEQTLAR